MHRTNLFPIGVPVRADPEFKAFVFSAAAAHGLGNKWVEGQLRLLMERLIERFSAPPVSRQARLSAVPASDSANSLMRLDSKFKAVSQLVRLGFAFGSKPSSA